jgi:hypothetical protein
MSFMEIASLTIAVAAALPFEFGDILVPAYLDAGTGSLIFQVLVASLVSAGVVFGGVMTQLRNFFTRVVLRRAPDSNAADSSAAAENATIPLDQAESATRQQDTRKSSEQRRAA